MTDLRHRLDSILGNEPAHPDDLNHIVSAGRRALRRRNVVTGVAGTAGAAVLSAGVVVPIVAHSGSGSPSSVNSGGHPTPSQHCGVFLTKHHLGKHPSTQNLERFKRNLARWQAEGRIKSFKIDKNQVIEVRTTCMGSASPTPEPTKGLATPTPTPTKPPAPRYHYKTEPSRISHRLAAVLANRLDALSLGIVYQRPFAQETSTLEKGHPSYYDGNDDVQVGSKLGDVGVQVTHAVTTQVPFDGTCNAPDCVQTTLPDGSLEQVSSVTTGTGGGTIMVVEIHRANGLVVEAQESNYAFGPEATRAHGKQPLTLAQLKHLAADPAFTF
jgi:hypothetical protein